VYAISYGDSFVVKRIKDNDLSTKGVLVLHSDNPLVGGSNPVPADLIRHIWKVLRIIDSPAD
jgi:phage repressor protein C with HTH and peptisase S24 domain